ncbi:MAG: methyltransferase [Rhodospirillaceae bacterium]|nr:methyltransferase [Rhodospirillaceae bacterium]
MSEINLLDRLPKSKRNVSKRSHDKTDEHIRISREYGEMYFDGPREYGYGGYHYDGRWIPVAEDMISHFELNSGMRVLDIGAARGFLVKDFMIACPGLEAFGIDVSEYALATCEKEVVGRLHLGSAVSLPFPNDSFDAVISLNTLHNLKKPDLLIALREIMRVTKNEKAYVQVDSYRNSAEKEIFLDWVLTAYTHGFPHEWEALFKEAGYTGDYFWTLI